MTKLRNTLLAALGLVVLNTVIVLYSTRATHATGSPVTVQVTGTASTADINNSDLQPVQFYLFPHSTTSNQNAQYFPVPAGKRLVIDYYSAQAQDLSGGAVLLTLGATAGPVTTTNTGFVSHIIFVNKDDTNAVSGPVKIYADPGTTVQAFVANASPATSCGSVIYISGHYVNVP